MFRQTAVSFVNSTVIDGCGGVWDSLRICGGRIDRLGAAPQCGDVVIDGEKSVITPGFVNAHDHLELNSFGRLKWRPRYTNVRDWIADFQPRFATDPSLAGARPDTLPDRLWVGGLKNLLCGVTTVCHHNPIHRALRRRFPVRVLRRFGRSHSLQLDGAAVAHSYGRTPRTWPWIVHASEGVDRDARHEVAVLQRLGCLDANTVLVHGVAIRGHETARVLESGASLVWCPSSNRFLFGETAVVKPFSDVGRLAIGTDSRLSGDGDLLDELRAAVRTRQLSRQRLLRAVTSDAARILRLRDGGMLSPGRTADVVMLRRRADDPYESVVRCARADVRLSMVGGQPLYGEPAMRPLFERKGERVDLVLVDGMPRLLAHWIARRASSMTVRESGLEVLQRW
jgi:cytosine/adenosine deaminase-related metal-dependent hydrolase